MVHEVFGKILEQVVSENSVLYREIDTSYNEKDLDARKEAYIQPYTEGKYALADGKRKICVRIVASRVLYTNGFTETKVNVTFLDKNIGVVSECEFSIDDTKEFGGEYLNAEKLNKGIEKVVKYITSYLTMFAILW